MILRWFVLCLLLFCFGCNTVPPEHLRTFHDAQSAFDAEEYRRSAVLYEQLLNHGVRSGTVYYNLGNAWAKAGDSVRAVAAYYVAQRYIPGDPHLEANLHAVLTSHGGIMPSPENSLVVFLFFWQNWIGYDAKIWISIVCAAGTFLGGVLCLFGRSKRLRHSTIIAAALTAIALTSAGYDWYRFEYVKRVIVTTEVLPRKGNSEQYEPAFVSPISFGASAVILDERNGWYLLRFSNGQEGWLPQSQTFPLPIYTKKLFANVTAALALSL